MRVERTELTTTKEDGDEETHKKESEGTVQDMRPGESRTQGISGQESRGDAQEKRTCLVDEINK